MASQTTEEYIPDYTRADVALSTEQVARYNRDGFLSIEALTSAEEVATLVEIYDRLFEPGASIEGKDRLELASSAAEKPALPQIVNPDHYAPELRETQAYRNAFAVARQLLGTDTKPSGMHAIRKPARDGAATPWHQDEAYWDPAKDHHSVSIWVPLQAATVENGCMQFVAGSHQLDIQEHRLINPEAHGLELASLDLVHDAQACPLPPGGATVHGSKTLHYCGPNTSDGPRRALIMAFSAPSTKLNTPRDLFWQRPEWSH